MKELDEKAKRHAALVQASYKPLHLREAEINAFYPNEYEIIKNRDNHLVVRNRATNQVTLAMPGTDITNERNRRKRDLLTDGLVTFGVHQLGNRFQSADREVQSLIREYGKDNITIAGHSLSGQISSDLSLKHGVESYSFNRGGSHLTNRSNIFNYLNPRMRRNKKKNNVFFSRPSLKKGFDPLSILTTSDPLAKTTFVKQGELLPSEKSVLNPHSIGHFTPKNRQQIAME